MNKIPLLLIAVCTLASCSKQENIKSNSTKSTVSNQTTPKTTITPKGNSALQEVDGANFMAIKDGACIPPAINCNANVSDEISDAQSVKLADAEAGGAEVVAEVFNSSAFSEITQNLPDNMEDNLTSGTYLIKKNYETGDKLNYMCGTSDPLTFENMEFVIEFDKE